MRTYLVRIAEILLAALGRGVALDLVCLGGSSLLGVSIPLFAGGGVCSPYYLHHHSLGRHQLKGDLVTSLYPMCLSKKLPALRDIYPQLPNSLHSLSEAVICDCSEHCEVVAFIISAAL